ncbi:transcription termination/antitermination NusG family protein [Neolewinella maritima]|uniref:transcription termination/antitermination NusG family protein n=1 Tax=Neolewinella maritima TaxID=1383882 RepID=UPI001EE96890|nr:transcription termination/antitermination NusG family protein [Neolewinella maritima]
MPIISPSYGSGASRRDFVDDLDPQYARWFALRVGHRKEKVVAKQLQPSGIEVFVPLRDRPFHYKSKVGVRQLPLLGGYVFVRIVTSQATLVLQPTFVFGFVKLGRSRRQVTASEIELLRRISTDHSLQWDVEDAVDAFQPGCAVEIARGPLAGVRGQYVTAKSKKIFLITFAGLDARLMTYEVAPEDVIPLSSAASGNATAR